MSNTATNCIAHSRSACRSYCLTDHEKLHEYGRRGLYLCHLLRSIAMGGAYGTCGRGGEVCRGLLVENVGAIHRLECLGIDKSIM